MSRRHGTRPRAVRPPLAAGEQLIQEQLPPVHGAAGRGAAPSVTSGSGFAAGAVSLLRAWHPDLCASVFVFPAGGALGGCPEAVRGADGAAGIKTPGLCATSAQT